MKINNLTPDQVVLSELGQRLARMRKQQGLTQTKLAEEAGLGVATLRRIESGQSAQMDSWLKIMKALKLTASVDAFLPENFTSPLAQVLMSKSRHKKKQHPDGIADVHIGNNSDIGIKWGDQS